MFFWLLPLIGCFKLDRGKKAIFSLEQFMPPLYFDRMHVIAGDKASAVKFDRIGDRTYDIRFDGVSMCPKFPTLRRVKPKIAGCSSGSWEVRPIGPYFKIVTKDSKGEEYCWMRSSKSKKNKVRLGRCGSNGTDFKIEDITSKTPMFKRAVKKLVNFLFGRPDSHEGWDSESGSSSEDGLDSPDTPPEKDKEGDNNPNDNKKPVNDKKGGYYDKQKEEDREKKDKPLCVNGRVSNPVPYVICSNNINQNYMQPVYPNANSALPFGCEC